MSEANSSYPANGRVIIHLDMNAFYCSVHEAEQPEKYKGKPTAVSGSVEQRRGIVVTCSYEARAKGVKTAMTVRQAQRLCPELVLIQPDFDLYRQYSQGFMSIARQYTPLVESVSIDECYMDITGSKLFGTPLEIAALLQERIRKEWGLPCSIGLAPNKLLAKMASDMKKPDGLTVLRIRDVPHILWHKPCGTLFGVGRKTEAKLQRLGIQTIGQLAAADEALLVRSFGINGSWMKRAAHGIDHSPVNGTRERNKSIGHTTTLPADLTSQQDVFRVLLNLSDQTGRRLRRQKLVAGTVQITIRRPDMTTITRAQTLPVPTQSSEDINREARSLFLRHWKPGEPIRLLGISLHNLSPLEDAALQMDLFSYEEREKKEALIQAMDKLRDKFGEGAVLTAGMLGDDPSTLIRNKRIRGTSLQKDDSLLYIDE